MKFLLENVDMKRSHMKVISDYCGVFPVNINSNLVSAQNRNRWYWTNIRTKQVGIFGEIHSDIPQPKDKGVLIRDIIEKEVDEKYYLSDRMIDGLSSRPKGYDMFEPISTESETKARCITARVHKMGSADNYIKIDKKGTPKKDQSKASCFSEGGNSGGNHSDMDLILQLGRGFNKGGLHQNKTPTLTKNSWEQNNLVIQLNQSKESGGKQPYQQNRVYVDYGKMTCLDTDSGRKSMFNQNCIRRLTPTECARLQTIPDWYEWIVSDTQIYRMLGNGWTVDVIVHILSFMFVESHNQIKQGQLF